MFALVVDGGEVPEDADLNLREPHVVPELLAMVGCEGLDGLALDVDLVLAEEIHIVLVADLLAVEVYRKVVLLLVGYVLLAEHNLQGILIHVLVEERAQLRVHQLAAAVQVVAGLLELIGQYRIGVHEPQYVIILHRVKWGFMTVYRPIG